jgi:hypothetical protein
MTGPGALKAAGAFFCPEQWTVSREHVPRVTRAPFFFV